MGIDRRNFNKLILASVAGIMAGFQTTALSYGGGRKPQPVADKLAAADNKHACKGMNACKGQGACKTSDNGCAGKNSCKGKGGCAIPVPDGHV